MANPDEEQGPKLLQEAEWLSEFIALKIKGLEGTAHDPEDQGVEGKAD